MRWPVLALLLLAAAAPPELDRRMDGAEARRVLERDGALDNATVEGDLNLDGLRAPANGILLISSVVLHGSLHGAPAAPLDISQCEIGGLRASHTVWLEPLTVQRTAFTGRVGLDGTRFAKAFACRRCRFAAGFSAWRARFEEEADFGFSSFAGVANFGAASFHAAAFDGARFADPSGPLFHETDFAGPVSFAGIDTTGAPIAFRGAAFRSEASFRGCRVGPAVFAPTRRAGSEAGANPFESAVTVFGGVADFRRCRFDGGANFAAAALRAGARFDDVELLHGVLDLRDLTQAGGDIVLRNLSPGATIAADERSVGSVVADRATLAPARWRLLPDALDALAARAQALGAASEGRRLAFAAAAQRAGAPAAGWTERAAWALQWPSENFTNLARPLLLAALAWLAAFLIAVRRGVLADAGTPDDGAKPLARVLDPLYRPHEPAALKHHPKPPVTWHERSAAAAAFAFALVFKLGSRRWRPTAAGSWQNRVLAALWISGFALVPLVGVTALYLLPGLKELLAVIPGCGTG